MRNAILAWSIVLVVCSGAKPPGASIDIVDAVIRSPLSGRDVTSAYMRIRVEENMRLVGAFSPQAERIELHTHEHVDGLMRMRRLEYVDLPSGERIVFESGGLHLMLFGVSELSEPIEITLEFASGRRHEARFSLLPPGRTMMHSEH